MESEELAEDNWRQIIVHLDLKPNNIFLTDPNPEDFPDAPFPNYVSASFNNHHSETKPS